MTDFNQMCHDAGNQWIAASDESTGVPGSDKPQPSFPMSFAEGKGWNFCACYSVADYAAELGFLADVIGLAPCMVGEDGALLKVPNKDFHLQIAATPEGETATTPQTVSLMFRLDNLADTVAALKERGAVPEEDLCPVAAGSTFHSCTLRTPHGVEVVMWGDIEYDRPD